MAKKPSDRRSTRERRLSAKPASAKTPKERRTPAPSKNRREGKERRMAVRIPIDLWMEEVRGDEVYFRRSCNISEGGVFFEQSIPHPVGTHVTLRFSLPGTPHELTVDGDVVSAAHVSGLGMGVKFTKLAGKDKALLASFIKETLSRRNSTAR